MPFEAEQHAVPPGRMCCFAGISTITQCISRNSYGIYLFHSPLIYITASYIPEWSPCVVVFMNLVVFGFLAYLFTVFVRRIKLSFVIGEI